MSRYDQTRKAVNGPRGFTRARLAANQDRASLVRRGTAVGDGITDRTGAARRLNEAAEREVGADEAVLHPEETGRYDLLRRSRCDDPLDGVS
jgi:hypothetical protein